MRREREEIGQSSGAVEVTGGPKKGKPRVGQCWCQRRAQEEVARELAPAVLVKPIPYGWIHCHWYECLGICR